MEMNDITDLDIQALIDGEVDEVRSVSLLDSILKNPALYHRYNQYKSQKDLLKLWWKDN